MFGLFWGDDTTQLHGGLFEKYPLQKIHIIYSSLVSSLPVITNLRIRVSLDPQTHTFSGVCGLYRGSLDTDPHVRYDWRILEAWKTRE